MSATSGEMDESILSAYVDGELDDDTRTVVERRVAESDEWRAILDEVRTTRDAVRALPHVDAPTGYWHGVLEARRGDVVDLAATRERRARARRWGGLAAAATAAAVLGVVLVPRPDTVRPQIATLSTSHAERSSLGNDVTSSIAGAMVDSPLEP
jgi:anti-sigma factor RsiW